MDGIILIDKPEGISSFGVVAKVRGILRAKLRDEHELRGFCTEEQSGRSSSSAANRTQRYDERAAQVAESIMHSEPIKHTSLYRVDDWRCKCRVKVGHTGTLDPAATGLLVLAIGKYTKKVPELIKQDKVYEVTMILGKKSSTGDKEGVISEVNNTAPTEQELLGALKEFTGEIMQTPPAFSAIKVNGQRAYDLARQGKEFKLEPRKVVISSNELASYNYPIVTFTSHVSSGTYIRTLVEDIGDNLGTGAYMSDLRRTKVGDFDIKDACMLAELTPDNIQNNIRTLTNSKN